MRAPAFNHLVDISRAYPSNKVINLHLLLARAFFSGAVKSLRLRQLCDEQPG